MKEETLPQTRPAVWPSLIPGEALLGFLAIVAAALTGIPLLFKTTPAAERAMEACQWAIISLFAIEYAVSLWRSESKRRFILSFWRMVDAATILIPLMTLVPGVSGFFRSSTILRLVRLGRVVALGARAGGVMIREQKADEARQAAEPLQIRMLPSSTTPAHPRQATWSEFVQWAKDPGEAWYGVSNVGKDNVAELAAATGLSESFIAAHLLGAGYPHIETTEHDLSLFLWVPARSAAGLTERHGLLLLADAHSVVTFCRQQVHLMDKVLALSKRDLSALPFAVRTTLQVLRAVIKTDEGLVAQFEQDLARLEDLPVRESRQQFFEQTFRLKKELSATQADLWRMRSVLKTMAENRVRSPGWGEATTPLLRELSETADYLYETVSNTREGVLSLIDLHLNVVSFEMNRVMRVLAVVSVLGLIPAVIGGLFGMNLADNPWQYTLPQVTFAVGMGMVTCLYFFVVKGWLR